MSRLALYLLGPPRVYLDGAAVRFGRRKILALLAYLAVTAERHSRDELAELLFSEQDREHSRADLRQILSLLGSAIGEDRLGSDREGVRLLGGGGLWIDAAEYRRLLENARSAEKRGELDAAQGHLTRAVELFRGEFLSGLYLKHGVSYEEWQLGEQESLRQAQVATLRRLVEIHGARSQYERAIELARRWLALDPLEEAVHRHLMLLHSLVGRHSEALRQYERCRSVLELELGEKPGEQTEELRRQITSGGFPPEGQGTYDRSLRARRAAPLFLFVRGTESEEEEARRQDAWLREVFGTRGNVLEAAGLSLRVAFPSVQAAVEAVLAAQRGARSGGGIQAVLMTGRSGHQDSPPPELVEQAETILEASYPGSALLTEAAARLASQATLPEGATVRCLGAHRLRDLCPAQTLYELEHRSFPRQSAALKTLDDRPNNLQTQPTPFIGRREELAAVQDAVQAANARLVTLSGAAGTGKTRLALQAAAALAASFEDGVFYVDLSSFREPGEVVEAVTAALGLRERGVGRSLMEALRDHLRGRQVLLVLDTFEHLLSATPVVTRLLADCPRLSVLATSREPLRVRAERLYPVPPMQLPSEGQSVGAIKRSEAVRLFVERALAVRPDLELNIRNTEAMAEICRRLDGLPLAIELAAARAGTLTPKALLEGLRSRLDLLRDGPRDLPTRQQTLRGEIDWSHELLEEREQRLFRRLSVFPVGCAPDAAEAVCIMTEEDRDVRHGLSRLTEKSLIKLMDARGEPRFRMLETIREYALERLRVSGEAEAVQQRHARHFLGLAETIEPGLNGPDQVRWVADLRDDLDNLRAALRWAREHDPAGGLRLAAALLRFWVAVGSYAEGSEWLERILERRGGVPDALRAKGLLAAGYLIHMQGDFTGAVRREKESLRLFRRCGEQQGVGRALIFLSGLSVEQRSFDQAKRVLGEGIACAREAGDTWGLANGLRVEALLASELADFEAAERLLDEALVLFRRVGDKQLICWSLRNRGLISLYQRAYEQAVPFYRESLTLSLELGDKYSIAQALEQMASILVFSRDRPDCAARLFGGAEHIRREIGTPIPPNARVHYDQVVAGAKEKLGAVAFEELWSEGRATSLTQLAGHAMENTEL